MTVLTQHSPNVYKWYINLPSLSPLRMSLPLRPLPSTDNYTLDDLAQILRSIPKMSDFPTLNQAVDAALQILTNIEVRVHVFLRRKVGNNPTP